VAVNRFFLPDCHLPLSIELAKLLFFHRHLVGTCAVRFRLERCFSDVTGYFSREASNVAHSQHCEQSLRDRPKTATTSLCLELRAVLNYA